MEKRILSVCLTACMLLTLMPSAFAADAEQPLPIAGMEQTEETSADARTEPGDEPQEPVPTEEGKGTQEEPFTTVAAYNAAVKGDALDGKDVYLTISRTEFKEGQFALTNVQTRPESPQTAPDPDGLYLYRQYRRRQDKLLVYVFAQLPVSGD